MGLAFGPDRTRRGVAMENTCISASCEENERLVTAFNVIFYFFVINATAKTGDLLREQELSTRNARWEILAAHPERRSSS